jgi:hypothetical protein
MNPESMLRRQFFKIFILQVALVLKQKPDISQSNVVVAAARAIILRALNANVSVHRLRMPPRSDIALCCDFRVWYRTS